MRILGIPFILAVFLAISAAVSTASWPRLSIWCEFMPYNEVIQTLPTLKRYDCDLLLHVGREDIGSADLVALCRAARSNGVNVAAWLLLPYDEQLYVGEGTADAIRDFSLRFVGWAQKENLGIDWVVFDCEPSPLLGGKLFAAVRRGRVIALARILRGETEPVQFSESVDKLNGLIDELHGRGVKVMGAANRVFLDFMRHGNTAAQDSLNAPFSRVRWDRASFITYRYKASQVRYVGMVNRYAELARQYFGDKAALDLGLLGDQRDFPEHRERAELSGGGSYFMSYLDGMRSIDDLRETAGVALGRGVTRINLYSLDGAVDSVAGLDYWLRSASEARPLTGLDRWTPIASAKMGFTGWLLDALYRTGVGGVSKDWKISSENVQPLKKTNLQRAPIM
jgi:hypothetical protein